MTVTLDPTMNILTRAGHGLHPAAVIECYLLGDRATG